MPGEELAEKLNRLAGEGFAMAYTVAGETAPFPYIRGIRESQRQTHRDLCALAGL